MNTDATTTGSFSTSSSLIARVRQSQPDAWQRLVDLYSPLVYGWCRLARLPAGDAADVTQETFLAVLLNIASFRHDQPEDTFRGWLYTITRNKLADRLRRLQREPQAAGGSNALVQLQQLPQQLGDWQEATAEQSSLYRRALDLIECEFERSTWRAFLLVVVEGKTTAEIAELLDITPGAVRTAKYRVLRRLKQELGDLP